MKTIREQFKLELKQLQNHFKAQPANPPLWIAIAEIKDGEAENFERSYVTSILPPDFHLPEMDVPLRNTKQTLALAGLEKNISLRELGTQLGNQYKGTTTNPVYKVPTDMMEGVKG